MSDFILDNIEKFTYYIPTATGSDLNELKSFLVDAEEWIKGELLGPDLYSVIKSLDPDDEKRRNSECGICLHAYLSAIPFLDLIQTPNGFAVVNNGNQAPASKERVDKLLKFVEYRLSEAIDGIITDCLKDDAWWIEWAKDERIFNRHTEIVYMTAKELREYANNNSFIRKDLLAIHSTVLMFQSHLSEFISVDYMAEIITKRRNSTLTDSDIHVLQELKTIIGLKLQKTEVYHLIENLLNYMIQHAVEFPTYINSVEYKLKIARKYENKKRDSTFFFGG